MATEGRLNEVNVDNEQDIFSVQYNTGYLMAASPTVDSHRLEIWAKSNPLWYGTLSPFDEDLSVLY